MARSLKKGPFVHYKLEKKVQETILVGGAVGAFITGAWVPIGMGVVVIEVFLILEGKYSEVKLEDDKPNR